MKKEVHILLISTKEKTAFVAGKILVFQEVLCSLIPFFNFFSPYCCAGWGYIVAFIKVLTMYQIYHT
jgi:hypothetical protein